jgi:type I restriction enzyme S subunit
VSAWPTISLGELARPKQYPVLSRAEMQAAGHPVYGANGKIGFSATFTHDEPVILIGCRGSCGTVHLTEPRSYANGNAMALDGIDLRRADLRFLSRFFAARGFADVTTGSSQPQIIQQNLSRVQIPLPPLSEQRRIAAILDEADALRAKRRAALAQLDEMARAIFVEMFGDRDTIRSRWPQRRLVEICRPKQWPTITSQELLQEGYPVYGANGLIGYFSTFNHAEPTVLITCRGATCGTINISPPNCYVTGNAMALDDPLPDQVQLNFLAEVLRMRGVDDAISGSAQPQITRQSLSVVEIALPPLQMQREYAAAAEQITLTRKSHEGALASADALFASLQHRAFRGEL